MPRPFEPPHPNFALMRALAFVNSWRMLEGLPFLRQIPGLRDLPMIRGHFRIRAIDFPPADRSRLRSVVNQNTAAFVSPNHPEFGFDWMMDKHIQTIAAPRMASWASHEIIRTAPWFWTRNNLIAHNGGNAAMEFSVAHALAGDGVLLHPEGTVRWTADRVHPLFPGIGEMACAAAPRGSQPVFIVPIVWKLRFLSDVSAGLHAEMDYIERQLGLRTGEGINVSERFRALQENILTRQMLRHDFDARSLGRHSFFERQEVFQRHLLDRLDRRYSIESTDSIDRAVARFRRVISTELRQSNDDTPAARDRRATLERDLAASDEACRLGGFTREVYGGATLTQEQIAESLKRHRATLVTSGLRNTLHNFLPAPYGPRVAHVRVPEPILVDPVRASGDPESRKAYVAELVELTRERMQYTLDAVNREIARDVDRFRHPNPFADRRMDRRTPACRVPSRATAAR